MSLIRNLSRIKPAHEPGPYLSWVLGVLKHPRFSGNCYINTRVFNQDEGKCMQKIHISTHGHKLINTALLYLQHTLSSYENKTQSTPAKKVSGGSIYLLFLFSEMSDVFGQERTYIAFLEPNSFFLDSAVCKQFRATISAKAKFFPESAGCSFGNILDISPLSELARRQHC